MAPKISRERVGEIMQILLRQILANGGEAKFTELISQVEALVKPNAYESEVYESNGKPRWVAIAHFYSIDCVKAGWLVKSGGRWSLTPQGEEALNLSAQEFFITASSQYKAWRARTPRPPKPQVIEAGEGVEGGEEEEEQIEQQLAYEVAAESARTEIEAHIYKLGPYDFQNLVGYLLEAMGYFVPYIADPGPDGGVDLLAYKDPLGTSTPRIVVQVKHRTSKLNAKELRELASLVRKDGDVGLIVSTGGFTSDAKREMQLATRHIEFMDLERFIDLWQQYYEQVPEKGRKLLPLVKLHFLAPPRS